MTAIDREQIAKLLADGDSATTTTARGRALKDLVVYLFELVPGVTVTARNTLNAFQAEEIDVAFWNEGEPGGLRMFDHILLVECKNWSTPAGYPELAVFNDKRTSRGRPMGIFVAAVGITGNVPELTAAHGVLARALAQGREIIVLTRREIEGLADTDHLVRLLKRKRAQLAVSGTIFEQHKATRIDTCLACDPADATRARTRTAARQAARGRLALCWCRHDGARQAPG